MLITEINDKINSMMVDIESKIKTVQEKINIEREKNPQMQELLEISLHFNRGYFSCLSDVSIMINKE